MPKGVICAGALDGSNQAGAIVTCQAMTARPFGAGPSAANAAVAQAKIPSDSRTAAMQRRSPSDVIRLLPIGRCFLPKRASGSGLSADLPGRGNRLGATLSAGRGAPIPRVFRVAAAPGTPGSAPDSWAYEFIPSRAARAGIPAGNSTAGTSRNNTV